MKEAELVDVCNETSKSAAKRDKYTGELGVTQVKLELVEARADKAEKKYNFKEYFRRYRRAFVRGIEDVRGDAPRVLSSIGLSAPDLAPEGKVKIQHFFQWLRTTFVMVESGRHLKGDLSTLVSA